MSNNESDTLYKWMQARRVAGSKTLVLFLHGLDSSKETQEGVVRITAEALATANIFSPQLPFKWARCFNFKTLAEQVLDHLDREIAAHGAYERVYLMGHSAGGVLAQVIYLLSRQAGRPDGLAQIAPDHVHLILIAAINRGWQISHHLPLLHKISWNLGVVSRSP